MCLRELSKCFLSSVRFGGVVTSLGSLFMPSHSLGDPDIQPKPPLTQLQAFPSGAVTGDQGEGISACLSTSPCEDAEDQNEVSPQSLLLQAEQNKCPEWFLTQLPLQALHHIHSSPLGTL